MRRGGRARAAQPPQEDADRHRRLTGAPRETITLDDHVAQAVAALRATTGAWRSVPTEHCVEATGWPGESPMAAMTARARADEQFTVHTRDTTHDVLRQGPDRVLALIADL